jgi:hypothetical protein
MELKTAIEILQYHQEWRRGKRNVMIHEPKILTQALDVVLDVVLAELQKPVVTPCDVCGSYDVIEAPHMGKNCNSCHPL